MSGRQHTSAERIRAHRDGQRKIVHYCSCGRAIRGNAGWYSHTSAHRGSAKHVPVTYSAWLAIQDGRTEATP